MDVSSAIREIILEVPGFLIAITVHEFTHGYVAYKLGDPTAKLQGRLTLNPISHLDPIGTLALILTRMIGWAKPVPVNPRYLRNPRRDMLWISLGGPAANIVAAIISAILMHGIIFAFARSTGQIVRLVIAPLYAMLRFALLVNVGLAIFNLIPIPPLDGSKILAGLLPHEQANQLEQLEPYGFVILILLLVTPAMDYVIVPPIVFIVKLLMVGLA
jgi:Zn-dependent protease